MTRGCNKLEIDCYSARDAVFALEKEKEWDNTFSLKARDVFQIQATEEAMTGSTSSFEDNLDDPINTGIHCIEELNLYFFQQISVNDADSIKEELKSNIDHFVHEALKLLTLSVESMTDITGILPSDMKLVKLQIFYSEKPTEIEWENFCRVLTTIRVDSLYAVHQESGETVDLDYLFHCLTKVEVNPKVKNSLLLMNGRVSAKRLMTLLSNPLQCKITLLHLTIVDIKTVTTLISLLDSTFLDNCSYEIEQGFCGAHAEKECKAILENFGICQCRCSPSLVKLLRNILNSASDFNKALYWPCLEKVEDVEYMALNILPLLQKKCETSTNGIDLRVHVGDDVMKTKMLELIQTKGIVHHKPNDTSIQLVFPPATYRHVIEHCGYHVFER